VPHYTFLPFPLVWFSFSSSWLDWRFLWLVPHTFPTGFLPFGWVAWFGFPTTTHTCCSSLGLSFLPGFLPLPTFLPSSSSWFFLVHTIGFCHFTFGLDCPYIEILPLVGCPTHTHTAHTAHCTHTRSVLDSPLYTYTSPLVPTFALGCLVLGHVFFLHTLYTHYIWTVPGPHILQLLVWTLDTFATVHSSFSSYLLDPVLDLVLLVTTTVSVHTLCCPT